MTEKQQSAPAEVIPEEEGLTFENILTEVRVHNCKDRTKLLIDGIIRLLENAEFINRKKYHNQGKI